MGSRILHPKPRREHLPSVSSHLLVEPQIIKEVNMEELQATPSNCHEEMFSLDSDSRDEHESDN